MGFKELFIKIITKSKNLIRYIYIRFTYRIVRIIDGFHDKRLCGIDFSHDREVQVEGATTYQGTCYWALDKIFKDAVFTPEDHFVDIGCGMGRVLAYLLEKNFPGHLTGIEYDPYVASVARKWIEKDKSGKVSLIENNAINEQYDRYNILYLARPFSEEFFKRLIMRLEESLTHPIRLYYLTDYYSISFLSGRQGWNMNKRSTVFMKYGLCLYKCPQYFSVWNYSPSGR